MIKLTSNIFSIWSIYFLSLWILNK